MEKQKGLAQLILKRIRGQEEVVVFHVCNVDGLESRQGLAWDEEASGN